MLLVRRVALLRPPARRIRQRPSHASSLGLAQVCLEHNNVVRVWGMAEDAAAGAPRPRHEGLQPPPRAARLLRRAPAGVHAAAPR